MVKVLDFMTLKYKNLYIDNDESAGLRKMLYKENTSVLAYYVITFILMNDYQGFIEWCNSNNISLLQFKKTITNQQNFCDFILKKYKSSTLLKNVKCTETFLQTLQKQIYKKSSKRSLETKYVLNNLRMTICELG